MLFWIVIGVAVAVIRLSAKSYGQLGDGELRMVVPRPAFIAAIGYSVSTSRSFSNARRSRLLRNAYCRCDDAVLAALIGLGLNQWCPKYSPMERKI